MSSSTVPKDDHKQVEVDATCIFRKSTKLRTIFDAILLFQVSVYESESPYVMIFVVERRTKNEQNVATIRMDVHKQDLANELRLWLFEGKTIQKSAFCVSKRVEHIMQAFVNLNKTPKQEDLIMWILSRAELSLGKQPKMKFGGLDRAAASLTSAINGVSLDDSGTVGGAQTIRSERKNLGSDFGLPSSLNNKSVEVVDKASAADVSTFALMSKLLGSRVAAINHIHEVMKVHSLATSSGDRKRESQYAEEIEWRKTTRAAQLSACRLLHSGGKRHPEGKNAIPPAKTGSTGRGLVRRPASAPARTVDTATSRRENELAGDATKQPPGQPPAMGDVENEPTEDAELLPQTILTSEPAHDTEVLPMANAEVTTAPKQTTRRSTVSDRRGTGSSVAEGAKLEALGGGFTSVTATWAMEVLNRQARMENRLGRSYYS